MMRRPAVAGQFYPSDPEKLLEMIRWALSEVGVPKIPSPNPTGPRNILTIVVPHAGYKYSGPTAASAFNCLAGDGRPSSFLVLGPNHRGDGPLVSIMTTGRWSTPLGDVEVDDELATAIVEGSELFQADASAHDKEHSIEVQLPFIQSIFEEGFGIVPIALKAQDLETSRRLGESIASSVQALGRDAVVVASSDLTHYERQASANKKDRLVIDAILKMDEALLFDRVISHRISMCGFGTVMAAISASKLWNAERAKLLDYRTSGDMTGDYSEVVGYASLVITR